MSRGNRSDTIDTWSTSVTLSRMAPGGTLPVTSNMRTARRVRPTAVLPANSAGPDPLLRLPVGSSNSVLSLIGTSVLLPAPAIEGAVASTAASSANRH